ncbi:MAG: GntR family transcriptional regulator [Pseudomonadota bacterium]
MGRHAKFERIAATLEADIRAGRIPRGDTLASEADLVSRFSVSRNTIRKSLSLLVAKGLIATRVGSGSFVTYNGELIDSAQGWSVSLSAKEARLQSRILSLARGPMEIECRELPIGSDCLKVDRIRFLVETGRGVSLERSRIPWAVEFAEVPAHGLVEGSITETLASRGVIAVGGREWAGVEQSLSLKDARLLGCDPGLPMLKLRRISRAADNSIVEFVESLLDPDLFAVSFEF